MGSLFQLRPYWETQCGLASEEYDGNCLGLANVDNDPSGQGSERTASGCDTLGLLRGGLMMPALYHLQ